MRLPWYPPLIVTGDNYESGIGIRRGDWLPGFEQDVHINVFNISKINAEVRGERAPRIKRASAPVIYCQRQHSMVDNAPTGRHA